MLMLEQPYLGIALCPLAIGLVAGATGYAEHGAGGLLSAVSLGEWRWRWRLPWRQALSALAGGLAMGLASRMVPACNVWHVWGGLPILVLQSLLFVAGLLPGAWLGGRLLLRFVVR